MAAPTLPPFSSTTPAEPPGFAAAVSAAMFGGAPQQPPDPYVTLATPAEAVKLLTETRKFCDPGREAFEQGWWKVLQYFLGRHWIYWDPSSRTFNDKRLAKWVPKPVTNKIRETYDSIYALLQDITPSVKPSPVGRSPKNVIAAETADEMAPLIHAEHNMDAVLPTADFWTILLGNSFLHPHWDAHDPIQSQQVPMWQCRVCQAIVPPDAVVAAGQKCPNCNAGGMALQQAIGPDGTPVMTSVTIGKGRTLALSPLELLLPLYAQSFEAVDRLIHLSWLPKHQIEDLAPETAKRIQWTMTPQQRSLQLYRSLAMQADIPLTPQQFNTQSSLNDVEGATVQYLWIKPCKRYPQGVYLPFFGEGESAIPAYELIEQANAENGQGSRPTIPYGNANGAALWPWIHYPYKRMAGRLYAQGAMEPILQKNDQINQIDSMTQLTANRMGNPIWMEPKGAEVERFTGEPGLIVRWQPVGAQGAKPERIPGENPPASFFQLRQQYLADIEDSAGTYDVVKGSKPSGVEAFSALNLLVERSQSRFTPTFKSRGTAYKDWFSIAIELERTFGPGERVHNVQGPNQTWSQQIFDTAKLDGAIEIKVEDGSNTPKTALGRRAAIEHSNQLGLLNPTMNPDQGYALMQELGVANLSPTLDADVKSCLQEQQAFEDWAAKGFQGPPPLVVLPWHNPQVHLTENRKWMNGDKIREILAAAGPNAPIIVQALGTHLQEHQMQINAAMMLQAEAAAPGGGAGAPPPGGQGAGRAMGDSNRESGRAEPGRSATRPAV